MLSLDEFDQVLDKDDTEMDQFILQEVLKDKTSTQVAVQIQPHEQSNQVCFFT